MEKVREYSVSLNDLLREAGIEPKKFRRRASSKTRQWFAQGLRWSAFERPRQPRRPRRCSAGRPRARSRRSRRPAARLASSGGSDDDGDGDPPDVVRVAYHEAAHVVVAAYYGLATELVTVVPAGPIRGLTRYAGEPDLRDPANRRLWAEIGLAGMAAAFRVGYPKDCWPVAGRAVCDHEVCDVRLIVRALAGPEWSVHSQFLLAWRYVRENLLKRPAIWLAVEVLAAKLLSWRTLDGDDIRRALATVWGSTEPPPKKRKGPEGAANASGPVEPTASTQRRRQ